MQAVDGTEDEKTKMEAAETARQEYIQSHKDYAAAKAAAAATAGAIVAIIASTIVTIATAGTAGPACAAFMGGLAGAALQELTEAAIQGNDYSPEAGAEDLAVALVTGLITLGMGSVAEKLAKGASATQRVKAIEAALKAKFGDAFASAAGVVATDTLAAALADFPAAYVEDLIRTEGLLRQELGGVGGSAKKTFKGLATGLVTKAVSWQVDQFTGLGDTLKGLKESGDWDEYADTLVAKGLVDLAVATVVTQISKGEMPNAEGWVKLLCKVASTPSNARLGTLGAQKDAASTLEFFNTATAEELQQVKFIGSSAAAEIIAARGTGGFSNIRQVLDVKHVRDDILTPAALEIRDDFLKLKAAEEQAGSGSS